VSPYLFITAIEVLVRQLQRDIKPVIVREGYEVGSVVFADYLSSFVPHKESLFKCIETITDFKKASGLQINVQNSEILSLGGEPLQSSPLVVKQFVKITGRFFSSILISCCPTET
jgi:hypothetical protein